MSTRKWIPRINQAVVEPVETELQLFAIQSRKLVNLLSTHGEFDGAPAKNKRRSNSLSEGAAPSNRPPDAAT